MQLMINVTDGISINRNDIQERFVRSSGPGGQNVNKVSTAVELRYDINKASLPGFLREKLIKLAGSRLSSSGILVIESDRFRTQLQNRQDAIEKLVSLVRQAARKPKKRKPTAPTFSSKKKRLEKKQRQSSKKQLRQTKDISGE